MAERLIKLCNLWKNISKQTGKAYFAGPLSFSSKLLIFEDENAKEGEPGYVAYLAEREPKQKATAAPDAERSNKGVMNTFKPKLATSPASDRGGLAAGDWPRRTR